MRLVVRLLLLAAVALAVRQWTHRPKPPAAPPSPPVSPALAVVLKAIKDHPVMVFSKSYCGYSQRAKATLSKYLPDQFGVMELDQRPDGPAIQLELGKMTGGSTVPRIFIDKQFVGGADDLVAMDGRGQLAELLVAKGLLSA